MSESEDDTGYQWYTASHRGVIPLDKFHISKNVQRIIRQGKYRLQVNRQFRKVMEGCADRSNTWISTLLIDSYELLHELGYAHSVELINREGDLAGGLYGVAIGSAFFGESMFRREPEVDKIALWHCHQILQKREFQLWDTQFYTDHLAQFGCIEIPADEYERLLRQALRKEAHFTIRG